MSIYPFMGGGGWKTVKDRSNRCAKTKKLRVSGFCCRAVSGERQFMSGTLQAPLCRVRHSSSSRKLIEREGVVARTLRSHGGGSSVNNALTFESTDSMVSGSAILIG